MTFKGLKKRYFLFLVNHVYCGTVKFEKKRKLLNAIGYDIGQKTKIVGPIYCTATLKIGENCWIGKNFMCNGNGYVEIGDNCDIAPEVVFQTGGHDIGSSLRRAGQGTSYRQTVGSGTWIGERVTIIGNTKIGKASVIGACALVNKDVPENVVIGGVPGRVLKEIE